MQILSKTQLLEVLSAGQVIVVPTETVLGLAVDATNPEAVDRLYRLKNRPKEKQSQLLVSSLKMATEWGQFSDLALQLAAKYWPGPLTLVLPSRVAEFETVGVRVPDHKDLLELIEAFGKPLMASSANLSGKPTPSQITELEPSIAFGVVGRLAGEAGGQPPSSVVSLVHDKIEVIRQGEISKRLWE